MTDAHVGRLLVAAIHQAIADELPVRSEFYEHWLKGERVRDGSVGQAAMLAVLGFLRAEGEPYHAVMTRAGRYAAEWTSDAMSGFERRFIAAWPRRLRARFVLRVARRLMLEGFERSKVSVTMRQDVMRVEVRDSLFCRTREKQAAPLCDLHVALVLRLLEIFGLPAGVTIESCLGTSAPTCVMVVTLAAEKPHMDTPA
jgi:predicted hydrocarbon binding protein